MPIPAQEFPHENSGLLPLPADHAAENQRRIAAQLRTLATQTPSPQGGDDGNVALYCLGIRGMGMCERIGKGKDDLPGFP